MSTQGYAAPFAAAAPPPAAIPPPLAAPGEATPPLAANPGPELPGGEAADAAAADRERGGGGEESPAADRGQRPPPAERGGERRPPAATLSVPDAALKLNIPERTLRNWIAAGTLPVVRPDPARGRRQMIRVPLDALEALLQDETLASRHAAAGGGQSPPAAETGGPSPDRAALEVLQARLEGAHAAAKLHAQRRHDERERYEGERAELKSELEFLRERVVRAEEAEREMRLLMAQQTQTLQQATRALQAFTERPALPEPPPAPWKIRWFPWRRA